MALRLFGYACNIAELLLSMHDPIFLGLSVSHPLMHLCHVPEHTTIFPTWRLSINACCAT